MIPGSAWNWITVNLVQQPNQNEKMKQTIMTTIHSTTSTGRSPLRSGLLFIPLALFLALAGVAGAAQDGVAGAAQEQAAEAQAAQAQIPPPVCPGPDCRKVITFYNNFTDHAVFPVIQAGIQNPDPWLQALFNDNSKSYAETHYSRVYVNPTNGIPPGGHVSVTVPWYSRLQNDDDQYADWYNGCRIVLFDTKAALDMATNDKDQHAQPLQFRTGSPPISCKGCSEPLKFYKSKLAYKPEYPFQLVEYTFADVKTTVAPPSIIDLHVGYNVSYLDQVYLPVALAPCLNEPCDGTLDKFAVGYLGTIGNLRDFRDKLSTFSTVEGWPQYLPVAGIENNPRLPGAFDVLVDRVEVQENGHRSRLTPPGRSVTDLIAQWKTCTSGQANMTNCPDYKLYQQINQYFRGNYKNYREHPLNSCNGDYPIPARLTELNILPYVYGWVPFNRECHSATFNDLKDSPGPETWFDTTQYNYIQLQYNYREIKAANKKQRFNPFTDLIHGEDKLNANSYAFSIDDLRGYQNHPGEGLIIAIGGPKGLPNTNPVKPDKPNYTKDFLVTLGDSIAQKRPRWKSFSVCGDPAEEFPPLPPNATRDTPKFIVDTLKYDISVTHPCTITVTDSKAGTYKFKVISKVPWPAHTSVPPPDPRVVECFGSRKDITWCMATSETVERPPTNKAKFDLSTRDPYPSP
jgi:hypothetical protein